MIEFLDGIAVFAPFGSSLEFFAHPERNVQHGVGQVKEERSFLVALNEVKGFVGADFCQFVDVRRTLHHLAVAHQGHASLVLEKDRLDGVEVVQQAEVVVESLVARKKRFVKPEVPFSDAGGLVAMVLEQFGKGQFVGMNPRWGIRPVHPNFIAHASRIATGQQARPRGAANRGRRIVIGKADAFLGHGIDTGGLYLGRSVASKVIVSLIIDQNENEVWLFAFRPS